MEKLDIVRKWGINTYKVSPLWGGGPCRIRAPDVAGLPLAPVCPRLPSRALRRVSGVRL